MKKKNSSTRTPYMSYLVGENKTVQDMLAWRHHELKEDELRLLMDLFWKWAHQDDALQLQKFYTKLGIWDVTWDRLIKENEDLFNMHQEVKKIIGLRREEQAWKGKLDTRMITNTLRLYNDDYRQVYNEDRDNKLQLNKEGGKNIQLVMEAIPSRDEVPKKPTSDK